MTLHGKNKNPFFTYYSLYLLCYIIKLAKLTGSEKGVNTNMKLKSIWESLSLKRKILTVFLPLILIPFLLVLIVSGTIIVRNGKAEAVKNAEDKLMLVSDQIDRILSNIQYNIKAFSTSSALQDAISEDYPDSTYGNYLFSTSIHSAIYNIMDIQSYISSGYVHTYDGKVYDINTDSIRTPDDEMNTYYDYVVAQKGRIILDSPSVEDTDSAFNISKSLIDIDTGECLGILSFNIKESLFYDSYRSVIDKSEEQLYLIDNNGCILSSEDREQLHKAASNDLWETVQEISQTKDSLSLSSNDFLVLATTSEIGEYHIVYVLEYYSIYREVLGLALILVCIGIFALIVTIILTTILAQSVTKPLALLTTYADRTGHGDFSADIQITSKDEIGFLAERFKKMNHNIRNLTVRIYDEQTQKKEYALNLLQAQINPHFLYNCLDNISSLITDRKNDSALSMLYHLGRYYRAVLSKGRNIITIREELSLVRDYLEIQLIKAPQLFTYTINIAEDILDIKIMKMLLQPIAENAVIHGFTGYKEGCHLHIEGQLAGSAVLISISDDGRGIPEQSVQSIFDEGTSMIPRHFGLRNIKERIRLKYGSSFGVTVKSVPGQGTKVIVSFPKIL